MTSEERQEARYQRRKAHRAANKDERCFQLGSIGEVFSYRDMFKAGMKCCNGVRWKQSTQNFEMHLFSGTAKRRRLILDRKWKPMRCVHFTLCERGKVRSIDAPHVSDRQVHKVACNKILTPLYTPSMIEDNGASQKDKGLHWHFWRLKDQLRWHYRHYGREGAVLLMDLKQFFPSAPRRTIFQRHEHLILEPDLKWIADAIVHYAPETSPGRGMPLGVEASQQEMVALPSKVDNWIKCQKGVKIAAHYMDDYILVLPTIEEAKKLGHELVRQFAAIGVPVNQRKCKVIPLTKPFKFCKAKFRLLETGKVIVNGCRDGVKRARRKLKLFKRQVEAGQRDIASVQQYMVCQLAYYKGYNDHGRVLRLSRLCYALFGDIMNGGRPCIGSQKTGPASA